MTTDLEDRIRTALRERAAEVTPQLTSLRSGVRRTNAQRWAPLLAAAAVLAVALAVVFTARHGSGSDTGGAAGGAPAYSGYQWRVTALQDRHGSLDVPADIDATISFTENGSVSADDTVNYLSATYVPGESTYSVENAASTAAGYGGGDPARERVIAAVDALFFTVSGAVPSSPPQVTIVATVRGDTLTLQTAGTEIITVTLDRQGPASDELTAPPSSTSPAPITAAPTEISGSASASDLPGNSVPASP